MNFGDFPRVIIEEKALGKNKILNEIFISHLEKDASLLIGISKHESFNTVIRLMASQIGNITNLSGIAKNVGISRYTIVNYLWYTEKTFVLK